jgi:peptidoglycan/xylan/chitin deacetylase (PgdA/CDA1 family)
MRQRLLLGLVACLALALRAEASRPEPNELGRVMILEYHNIESPEDRWSRTPENFRHDLETLYARGYRLVNLNTLLDRRITLPAGTSPVVLTFDDSSPGHFRYIEKDGAVVIDPKCAVGIIEAFAAEHPDFGRAATFYVLPGASKPHKLFNQPEYEGRKLRWLVEHGYEIGNHTLWHANLGKYPESTVRNQVAVAQEWIQREVPAYRPRTLALPHGVYPKDISWAVKGTVKGVSYEHEAILMVAGGAAPSPFSRSFDPIHLPRIQAGERDLAYWLTYLDRHPEDRFVSDGDPATITVPVALKDRVRRDLPRDIRLIER